VRARLDAPEVVAMQGDWTRPDALIARYLATFGRYGIPFDAVYGPAMPDGEALPELLTPETLMSALDRARGERR
jgi:suppressor for copper-sensitivity B